MNSIKKLIFPLFLLISFASCKSNSKEDTEKIQLLSDSTTYQNSDTTDSIKEKASNKEPNNYRNHSKERVRPSEAINKANLPTSKNSRVNTSKNSENSTASTQSTSSTTSQKTTKKGMSKGAQGAVIGGAAGAVGGAIISKHKGTGAAIGAAVGAASGYIIGKDREKKEKK